jgi:cold shock CspA family protein
VSDTAVSPRVRGEVKFFSKDKSFGFLKRDDGQRDVFLSLNNLPKGRDGLDTGEKCEFAVADNPKKGPYAVDVVVL